MILNLTHEQIIERADNIAAVICEDKPVHARLFGVPRGGIPAAYAVAAFLEGPIIVNRAEDADYIIDDLIDSGKTRARYKEQFPGVPFFSLFDKEAEGTQGKWYVFPWEGSETKSADDIPIRLLQYIGENPNRGGLLETPRRFLAAWKQYTSGYGIEPDDILKTFDDGAEDYNELVLVKNIPVFSHCEHHMAPFFGVAHVGYIPNDRIVGLSKISRVVDIYARRLQVQERLTTQIADAIAKNLNPMGVAVVISCRHMCMESRGVQKQGTTTVTSAMRGVFFTKDSARAEFLELIKGE